ncbi:TonB-dependent receptor [candidate division KSB1 bacterium]|nr:TonB-dependent receptor [candidate division KSB1 bacterium]
MRVRILSSFLLTWVMVCAFALTVQAGQTGKIVGRIIDAESGEGLPGVNTILEGTTMGAATDLEGYYIILNLPPGTYTVKSSMIGYNTVRVTQVKVSIDQTTTVNFPLQSTVLEIGEEITITAERPIVQKDLTSSLSIVRSEDIARMPVEDLADILELQAGVSRDSDGAIHIRGGRSSEVAYLVDGISITDPFAGELSVEVENSGIEQLQVISGGFNAEYGQALSGIVEIVTKEGGQSYDGGVTVYAGDYLSTGDDIFFNIDDVEPSGLFNIEGHLSGPVPLFGDKVTFFANARYFDNDGWLSGERRFSPDDSSNFDASDDNNWFITDITLGDSAIIGLQNYLDYAKTQKYDRVPMNSTKKLSLQGKLTYRLTPTIKFSVGALLSDVDFREYDHSFKLNPDGMIRKFRNGLTVNPVLTHALNASTFYTLKFAFTQFRSKEFLFEDPFDPRYVDPFRKGGGKANAFATGGTQNSHTDRETITLLGKFDVTSQIDKTNQIKLGVEFKRFELKFEEFEIVPAQDEQGFIIVPFQPAIPPIAAFNHNRYNRKPVEFSAYIQDKIELKELIINIGARVDYFDANGIVPTDLRDPSLTLPVRTIDIFSGGELWANNVPYRLNPQDDSRALIDAETGAAFSRPLPSDAVFVDNAGNVLNDKDWTATGSWFESSKSRVQVSPRVGISYPITDRGAIYFSYGFFFQKATFEHLYLNPEFEIDTGGGSLATIMGNANLKNQKTINWEIGLQQQIGENLGLSVTGFYKDINNLIGAEIIRTFAADQYARFVNLDYGNVRGVTVALDFRPSREFSAFLDYTLQVAEGNASDPRSAFDDLRATPPREPEIETVPLDWDQQHTLNLNINYSKRNNWGLGLIGKLNTGRPYTPTLRATRGVRSSFENSERMPLQFNLDFRAFKKLSFGGLSYSLFFKVFNLFDQRNAIEVFSSTGRADFSSDILFTGRVQGVNTLQERFNRPEFYSEPRRVQIGLTMDF